MNVATGIDLHFQCFRQCIHHRHTDTVQPTGNLVGMVIELAAGVQTGHDDFKGRNVFGFMNANRYTAPVVFHTDAVIRVNDDFDKGTVAGHGFVDAVIHHLIDQVMQPCHVDIPDIHGRTLANRFQPLQDLDVIFVVCLFYACIHILIGMIILKKD